MGAGDDPEDVVVVEGDVPLHVAWSVFEDVAAVGFSGGAVFGAEITVPVGTAVVFDGAAHQHHVGDRDIRFVEQLAVDVVQFAIKPTLDRGRGGLIVLLTHVADGQARLSAQFPLAAGRFIGCALLGPDRTLAIDKDLVALAQIIELIGRDQVADDHEAFFDELITVDFQVQLLRCKVMVRAGVRR